MKIFIACLYLNIEDANWKWQTDKELHFQISWMNPYYYEIWCEFEQAWIRDAFGHRGFKEKPSQTHLLCGFFPLETILLNVTVQTPQIKNMKYDFYFTSK